MKRARDLAEIDADFKKAEEDVRKAREALDKVLLERSNNPLAIVKKEWESLLTPYLVKELFGGDDPLLPLGESNSFKIKCVVRALKQWRDNAVEYALAKVSHATRTVVSTEEYTDTDDVDPQGRTLRYLRTTYSDGTSESRYLGRVD